MTQSRLIACVAAGLLLLGCEAPGISPSPGLGDPYLGPFNNPQISVLSPQLQQWIRFHPAIVVDSLVIDRARCRHTSHPPGE